MRYYNQIQTSQTRIMSKQISKQLKYILFVISSIVQALNVLNNFFAVIQVETVISTIDVTVAREIRLFGDPLSLSLFYSLSAFIMIIVFTKVALALVITEIMTEIMTLKQDEVDKASKIIDKIDRNNDIIRNSKCKHKKESNTNLCVTVLRSFVLVFPIIYVLVGVAHGTLLHIATFIAIYLFSRSIIALS